MIDLKHFQEIPRLTIDFLDSLRINDKFNYLPTNSFSTAVGKKINLGYNCYALKLYKITNKWNDISDFERNNWRDYILDFQNHQSGRDTLCQSMIGWFEIPFAKYCLITIWKREKIK